MATTPTLMVGAQITPTSTTLYTAPATGTTVVTNIVAANASSLAQQVTVNLANSGTSYPIISNVTVPANSSAFFDLKQVLGQSQTITGLSTGSGTLGALTTGTNATANNWNSITTNGTGTWVAVGATTGAAATTTGMVSTNNGVTWSEPTVLTIAGLVGVTQRPFVFQNSGKIYIIYQNGSLFY